MKNSTTGSKFTINKFKIILFTVASFIFGMSGAFAQGTAGVDVIIADPFQAGPADTSVNHKACFQNTSGTVTDRINITATSSHGWVVALFDTNYYDLLAFDVNGDGTWDYVNPRFDDDNNGEPDTKSLSPGQKECLNFKIYIPAGAQVGTLDTLSVFGVSTADKLITDMEFAFTEVTSPVVLPVELLLFAAGLDGNVVKINWLTATEINNDYFSIERSSDGKEFEEILVLRGAGNANSISSYAIEDKSPLTGISYYRLKQTDFDGQTETFNMVVVNNSIAGKTINIEQNAYPNPFSESFTLGFSMEERGNVTSTITDIQGRIISTEMIIAAKGYNNYSFNGNNLPKGLYFISFEHNGNVISSKVSKTTDY